MAEFVFIVFVVVSIALVLSGGNGSRRPTDQSAQKPRNQSKAQRAEGPTDLRRTSESPSSRPKRVTRERANTEGDESVRASADATVSADGAAEVFVPGGRAKAGTPVPRPPEHAKAPRPSPRGQAPEIRSHLTVGTGTFVEMARQLADRKESATPHVPLHAYWTTYEDMDRQQLRWYLYWRDRFRHGEALDTDLSYLFVYAYECLHAIGFDDPDAALDHLLTLWETYRPQHPKLDNYLSSWSLDLNAYYDLQRDPLDLVGRSIEFGATIHDPDLWIEAWLRTMDFEVLEEDALKRLSGFDPRSGKFYREVADRDRLLTTMRAALNWTDQHFRERHGSGVFDVHAPAANRRIRRRPFSGAVFEYERRPVDVAVVRPYSEEEPLRGLLASALKLAENALRSQAGFSGARRGIELPEDLESYLRNRLSSDGARPEEAQERAPERRIDIDLARVADLEQESAAIREQLTEGMDDYGTSEPTPARSERFDLPNDVPPGLLTDVDVVAATLDALPGGDMRLLHDARDAEWRVSAVRLDADPERIARLSSTHLGSSLVHREGSHWVVEDDYRDELDFLLEREQYAAPSTLPDDGSARTSEESDGEQDDADSLRSLLTPVHVHALTKIAAGCPREAFTEFAVENGTMSELLVEEINEHAMDVVGDVLVDAYEEPLEVLDEHRDLVSRLIAA